MQLAAMEIRKQLDATQTLFRFLGKFLNSPSTWQLLYPPYNLPSNGSREVIDETRNSRDRKGHIIRPNQSEIREPIETAICTQQVECCNAKCSRKNW